MQSAAEAQYRQTEQGAAARISKLCEKQLQSLRSGGGQAETGASEAVITPEQRQAIDAAPQGHRRYAQELRDVQLNLNREISSLQTWLLVLNIALVPAALTILAIGLALIQRARRARARSAA